MDVTKNIQTETKKLSKVIYGSLVIWDNTHWILADNYPESTLVNVDDGKICTFPSDHNPEVQVAKKAKIVI